LAVEPVEASVALAPRNGLWSVLAWVNRCDIPEIAKFMRQDFI
jgi:hypothetical protein